MISHHRCTCITYTRTVYVNCGIVKGYLICLSLEIDLDLLIDPIWGFPLTRTCLNFKDDTADISLKEISISEICLAVELVHV